MKAIKLRPFAFSCCAFILFSYLFYLCPKNIKTVSIIIALVLGTVLLFFGKKARYFSFYLILPILISSVTSLAYFNVHYDKMISYANKTADIEFVILEENYTSATFSTYTVKIESIDGERADYKSTLAVNYDLSADLFSVHSCKSIIEIADESQNGFTSNNYNLSQGIFLSAEADGDITDLGETRKIFPTYYLNQLNEYLSSIIDKFIPSDKSALCKALILGNKSFLNSKDTLNFRLLGMSHILAVSGMHLTILIGSFDAILSKLRVGKKPRYVTIIFLTLFYAGITGFSPSVKRAAIMLIMSCLAFLLSRGHDSFTSLCFSGAFLCLIEPHALFDVGLQLSFLSTMGIIVFASPASAIIKEKADNTNSKAVKLLYKSLSALLFGIAPLTFSLPVIWLSFGEAALLSPVSNIIFTPLISIIMYSCLLLLITSFITPLASIISFIPAYISVFTLKLADKLSHKAPVISINYDFTAYIIAFLVISLIVLVLIDYKNKFVFLIPFVICISAFFVCISTYNYNNSDKIKAVYTNNLYGDSFLIVSNGKALLCDISGCSYRTAKECEYHLGENHITRLDSYLFTDYHGQGIKTIEKISCLTKIDKLLLPKPSNDTEEMLCEAFLDVAKENYIECILYNYEDTDQISFEKLTIDVKNLAKNQINSPSSICVTLSNGNSTFSYIGRSCYTTSQGKQHLTKLFNETDSVLFGSYGKETKNDELMSLFYRPEIKLFFPSDSLYTSYRKTVSKDADVCITGNFYEFDLS